MKNQRGMTTIISIVVGLAFALSACTKPREKRISDEALEAQLVSIAELQGHDYSVTLSTTPTGLQTHGLSEKPVVEISDAKVPGALRSFFTSQRIQGKPGTQLLVRFRLERSFVFVERSVAQGEALSPLEQDLSSNRTMKSMTVQMVPLFAIPVLDSGVLIAKKNDNGEETSNLELRQTDIARATHVKLDLRSDAIVTVGFPAGRALQDYQEHVTADRLKDQVMGKSDLERILSRPLVLSPSVTQVATRLVVEPRDPTLVHLLIYSIRKKSQVTSEALLALLKSGVPSVQIMKCPKPIVAQAAAEFADDCVLVLEGNLSASNVVAQLEQDPTGAYQPYVVTQPSAVAGEPRLLKIPQGQAMTNSSPEQRIGGNNTFPVSFFKGKEFYFRRTFSGAPTSLMAFGPGASGTVELVTFELESDRVVVRKVLAVNGQQNPTVKDREELMSVPAKYYQITSAEGLLLPQPISTTPERADAVVLDWTDNTIPVGNSPLNFFSDGVCFRTVGHQIVKNIDQRLSEGILNFSIEGTYTFQPECMSYFAMNDYWYQGGIQTNYNLEERVSFMVNDGSLDRLTNQDLAFRAQSLMGFGVFTAGSKVPDLAGRTDKVTTEIAKPVIQNFTNGRVVTFVLGGLPVDPTYRDLIVKATRQTVEDWNTTLARAFKGTDLERSGPYLDLKVEGVDITPGNLGDLDRNYIWNYDKKLDSGLLGLSQAGPNPRTGFVVSNNVLMYSGNLLNYVLREKERALIQDKYEELKKRVLAQSSGSSPRPQMQKTPGTTTTFVDGLLTVGKHSPRAFTPANMMKDSAAIKQSMNSVRQSMVDQSAQEASVYRQVFSEKDYLQRIFRRAIEMKAFQDPTMMDALSATEILRSYGTKLSEDERKLLSLQSRQLALKAEFAKNFGRGPNCFLSVPASNGGLDLVKSSTEDIFYKWYASTLSHEIGHGLGLTHNFIASADKPNYEFTSEKSGRNYSSIMDYLHPTFESYYGPGPYDAHALRAAYTGLVEVHELVQKAAQTIAGKKVITVNNIDGQPVTVELTGGSLAKLNDLKNVYLPTRQTDQGAIKSWWDMQAASLQLLPLKAYRYCTDINAGGDPMCARFDAGASPVETMDFLISEYQKMYPVYNDRNANINITAAGAYVSRVMTSLLSMRLFLDEAFFQAIQGAPQEVWVPYAQAALKAMTTFAEIITNPTGEGAVFDESRFSVKEVEVAGADANSPPVKKQVLVERRALRDSLMPGVEGAVQTRGIEIDKILAMQLMTLQGVGHPRYEQVSLRVSYADFEKYMLGAQPGQSMTMNLVAGVLADSLPALKIVDGSPVDVGSENRVEVSEGMRYYGILAGSLFLDNTSTQDDTNPSRAFLVGRSLGSAPSDRFVVTRLGSSLQSPTALKLWSHDTAYLARGLVAKAARARTLIDNKATIQAEFAKVIDAVAEPEKALVRQALLQKLQALNQNGVLATAEEEAAGQGLEAQIGIAERYFASRLQLITQVIGASQQGQVPIETFKPQLDAIRNSDESLVKTLPFLSVALSTLESKATTDQQKQVAAALFNTGWIETHHSFIVGTLEQMNRIIGLLHPELSN